MKIQTKLVWKELSKSASKSLNDIKEETASQLEELSLLYDPENTGIIGLSDLYLLLKDLFINSYYYKLSLDGHGKENLFEAEGSYKELMSKLDLMLFEDVGLSKKMYQKAKNVSIDFKMVWILIDAMLQTGILNIEVDRSPARQKTVKESMKDDFEARAQKLMVKIQKMQQEERSLEYAELEQVSNKSQPEGISFLIDSPTGKGDYLEAKQHQKGRYSKSQPPKKKEQNSKKKFVVPNEIAEQIENNKKKENASHEESQNNSLMRMESSRNLLSETNKSRLNALDRSDSHIGLVENQKAENRAAMGKNPSKFNFKEVIDSDVHPPKQPHPKDLLQSPKQSPSKPKQSSKINFMVLKQSENIWRKSLTEIFCFYNKLQKQTRGEYSFENFKEKMNYMSLGEWIKFCSDFELFLPKPKDLEKGFGTTETPAEYSRKILTQQFKKEAKGSLGINYQSFEVILDYWRKL